MRRKQLVRTLAVSLVAAIGWLSVASDADACVRRLFQRLRGCQPVCCVTTCQPVCCKPVCCQPVCCNPCGSGYGATEAAEPSEAEAGEPAPEPPPAPEAAEEAGDAST